MAKKYIEAEKLIAEIERLVKVNKELKPSRFTEGIAAGYGDVLSAITSLQQDQPEFPTTDEEIEIFLATHPKVEVPNKYKTPDWLWKKLEQPEVDLKNEIITQWSKCNPTDEGMGSEYAIIAVEQFAAIARHFYELGLKARKEE